MCKSEVTLESSGEAGMQLTARLIQLEQLGCCCPETLQVHVCAVLTRVRQLSFLFKNSMCMLLSHPLVQSFVDVAFGLILNRDWQ